MKEELFKRILSSIILIPIALFFIYQGSFLFIFFIIICFLITAYEWFKMSKKKSYSYIGFIFIIFSYYSIYKLRNDFHLEVIIFILLICISTDIGGYIFGKIFKGPKLTKISPKKTYAGTVGAYLLSIILSNLYINFIESNIFVEFSKHLFLIIIAISTVSQLGDIIISSFKRLSKIKDTGTIIPGHGGILDRIDGMIFAFPFSYIFFQFNLFNFL